MENKTYSGFHKLLAQFRITLKVFSSVTFVYLTITTIIFGISVALIIDVNDTVNIVIGIFTSAVESMEIQDKFGNMRAFDLNNSYQIYSSQDYKSSPNYLETIKRVFPLIWFILLTSMLIAGGITYAILQKIKVYIGNNLEDGKYIRGAKNISSLGLKKMIEDSNETSDYPIGDLCIPKSIVPKHIGLFGDSGVGKSVSIMRILDIIRRDNKTAFIVDKTGQFVSKYYNPETDIILSPFDDRSVGWSVFNEGTDLMDFERLAKSFIPSSDGGGGNDHWPEASITVFSTLLYEMNRRGIGRSIEDLVGILVKSDKKVITDELGNEVIITEKGISKLLEGTMAELVIDPEAPDHAASVIASLVPKIRSMYYLRGLEEREQFSIRDWVQDDNRKGWVFIRVTEDQLDAVNPLVTAWIDIFVKTMLTKERSADQTVTCLIDELQSFEKINSLKKATHEGRKHALRLILGFTSTNELIDKYGKDSTPAMMSSLATKAVFRTSEPTAAKWSADLLGEEDIKLSGSNVSAGTNDNVSFNDDRRRQHVVMPSEIQVLKDLHCYIRFSGDWPSALLKTEYVARESIAEDFIKRTLPLPSNAVAKKVQNSPSKEVEARTGDEKPKKKMKLKRGGKSKNESNESPPEKKKKATKKKAVKKGAAPENGQMSTEEWKAEQQLASQAEWESQQNENQNEYDH